MTYADVKAVLVLLENIVSVIFYISALVYVIRFGWKDFIQFIAACLLFLVRHDKSSPKK